MANPRRVIADQRRRDRRGRRREFESEPMAFTKGCSGKLGYSSRRIAAGVVRVMRRNGREKPGYVLRPYKCKPCGRWHVGHTRVERVLSEGLPGTA